MPRVDANIRSCAHFRIQANQFEAAKGLAVQGWNQGEVGRGIIPPTGDTATLDFAGGIAKKKRKLIR